MEINDKKSVQIEGKILSESIPRKERHPKGILTRIYQKIASTREGPPGDTQRAIFQLELRNFRRKMEGLDPLDFDLEELFGAAEEDLDTELVKTTTGMSLYGKRRSPSPQSESTKPDKAMEDILTKHGDSFVPAGEAAKRRRVKMEEQLPDGEQDAEELQRLRTQLAESPYSTEMEYAPPEPVKKKRGLFRKQSKGKKGPKP